MEGNKNEVVSEGVAKIRHEVVVSGPNRSVVPFVTPERVYIPF